jgi:flavin-binding protein dodecin
MAVRPSVTAVNPVEPGFALCRQSVLDINSSSNLQEGVMADSVYKVIELVGTSRESWEKAATMAVERAAKSLRDLRIAEVAELDMQLKDGKVDAYRARVRVSFKYEEGM